uniref:Uncharacterized protein n=1 Tax=Lepeophtheirus salmonis TaxID=72036 RepID=A0A0K2UUJ3_LEPSM
MRTGERRTILLIEVLRTPAPCSSLGEIPLTLNEVLETRAPCSSLGDITFTLIEVLGTRALARCTLIQLGMIRRRDRCTSMSQ